MKHDSILNYPGGASDRALSVLLTVWPALRDNLRDDLVLVGGLAVYLHSRGRPAPFGVATVTLDVDLGIALAASAGTYSTLRQTLLSFGSKGVDIYGARHVVDVPLASLGPLLVLKLNAFANRRHPKDAFDFLTLAVNARLEAAMALRVEVDRSNPGIPTAIATLECFQEADSEGPVKALAFLQGDGRVRSDKDRRMLEIMATMGRILKDEVAKA